MQQCHKGHSSLHSPCGQEPLSQTKLVTDFVCRSRELPSPQSGKGERGWAREARRAWEGHSEPAAWLSAQRSARRFGAHGSSPLPPSNLSTPLGRRETWLSPRGPARMCPLQIPAGSGPATAGGSSVHRVLPRLEQLRGDTALPPRWAAAATALHRARLMRGAAAAPGRPRGCPGPAARQQPGSPRLPPALRFGTSRPPPRGKRALGPPGAAAIAWAGGTRTPAPARPSTAGSPRAGQPAGRRPQPPGDRRGYRGKHGPAGTRGKGRRGRRRPLGPHPRRPRRDTDTGVGKGRAPRRPLALLPVAPSRKSRVLCRAAAAAIVR